MENNVDRMFMSIVNSSWYYHKNDTVRFQDGVIYDNGTIMGLVEDVYDEEHDCFNNFILLPLRNFKSQPTWKTHKDQIVRTANKYGYRVIFVNELDIGFGIGVNATDIPERYKNLISLTKYAKIPNDVAYVTTAEYLDKVQLYSFAQSLEFEEYTAVEILMSYIKNKYNNLYITMLVEPNYSTILDLLENDAKSILFAKAIKSPPFEQMQIVNDILARRLRTQSNTPILYMKVDTKITNKYFEKENTK